MKGNKEGIFSPMKFSLVFCGFWGGLIKWERRVVRMSADLWEAEVCCLQACDDTSAPGDSFSRLHVSRPVRQ